MRLLAQLIRLFADPFLSRYDLTRLMQTSSNYQTATDDSIYYVNICRPLVPVLGKFPLFVVANHSGGTLTLASYFLLGSCLRLPFPSSPSSFFFFDHRHDLLS